MSSHAVLTPVPDQSNTSPHVRPTLRAEPLHNRRYSAMAVPLHLPSTGLTEDASYRQAELFYLQKQIQSQTPMVIVLEDGEQVEGQIEWYDRNCLKVRGRAKTLVYKSAIKYMYKLGDQG